MKQHKIYGIENIDPTAVSHFYDALKQDFAVKGALMPDAHVGKDVPIGTVMATKDVILPSFIGFDIGCGLCALQTSIDRIDVEGHKDEIFDEIYKQIPVAFKHRTKSLDWDETKLNRSEKLKEIYKAKGGSFQLGSLGGGKLIASSPRL